jgi:DNA (cytosine-5)-methyltransferase 1
MERGIWFGGSVSGSGRKLKAIDLYSGVGGWSLGLRLAGIEVVGSYERWGPANETNFKNNLHQAQTVDIRRLSLADLPPNIDIVVGSPPCTQFSFSNRGGGGDIADGLQDIIRFFKIVDHLKPRFWAMENVPRLAKIMQKELKRGGALARFRHLGCVVHVVNMAEYGLPQRRRRCIAGNFNYKLLESYRSSQPARTLGDVVSALNGEPVVDPNFAIKIPRQALVDHIEEDVLNSEEVRINRASKTIHTVYNGMPFPDPLDRSVRTITAVCTRVSRESIVIETPETKGAYRRLTLRERASLQGFPITFQFYGASFSQKLRMIGNAVPPSFAYLMGQALRGVAAKNLVPLKDAAKKLTTPTPTPAETPPDRAGRSYPANRTFRFAIPSLQLKSGVRFEFGNDFVRNEARWRISFYFGTSKDIESIALDEGLERRLSKQIPVEVANEIRQPLDKLKSFVAKADISNMQALWAHRGLGETRAFMLLDAIDLAGAGTAGSLLRHDALAKKLVERAVAHGRVDGYAAVPGSAKLARNAPMILAGLIIGSTVNCILDDRARRSSLARTKRAVR